MTRAESETVSRRLVDEWVELRGVTQGPSGAPSFSDFYAWLRQGYSPYLDFRSATSVRTDVVIFPRLRGHRVSSFSARPVRV